MEGTTDFNQALEGVGSFGLYQKLLICLLIVPSAMLSTLVYLAQFFIILVPANHWCHVDNPSHSNLTEEKWKNYTIPRSGNGQDFSSCEMFDINVTGDLSLPFWEVLNATECKQGWDYDFSSYYPTIATQLNWVCENDRLPYWSQTIYYIGTSIGTVIFGYIADKYGRRPSILLSYLVACLAGIGSTFATSFAMFSVLRFFVGACIIPLSEDPYVLSLEYIGVKRRTLAIVFWSCGYIIASAICPWISYAVRDWQTLCLISSVPLILIVLGAKWIPESASWLLMNGRHEETTKELKRVAKINGRSFIDQVSTKFVDGLAEAEEDLSQGLNVLHLFKMPRLRKHTFLLALSWFITYCCYHTNVHNTSNLGSNIYDSYTYGAFVEAPVMIIILCGIDRFGRRWPMVAALVMSGLTGITILLIPKDMPNIFLGVGLIQRLSLATNYNIIMQYSAEIYPTVLRGRGLAFLRLMGTFGLYLSPSLVYLALEDPAMPLMISGVMTLFLALITLFLPETLNQHLPHTLEEGEKFGRDQKIFDCSCSGNQQK